MQRDREMVNINPELNKNAFLCPHCNAYSMHEWESAIFKDDNELLAELDRNCVSDIDYSIYVTYISKCISCDKKTVWIDGKMVYPDKSAPIPADMMPDRVLKLYTEAGVIYTKSPRAACAILRLAIEELLRELGQTDAGIDKNIAALVRNGLPEKIQKALDVIRVIGNKAIHAGVISIDYDNEDVALFLFDLINIIIDNVIIQKEKIDAAFERLPKSCLESIEKRDNKFNK